MTGAVASRRPRSTLRLAMLALALAGLAIAAYLTYVHYAGVTAICSGGGCERVQTSAYAKLAGVPVALLGVVGYGLIAGLLVAGDGDRSRAGVLGTASIGAVFSVYLTYREVFTIDVVCQWCVASAAIMTLLAGLAAARFLQDSQP